MPTIAEPIIAGIVVSILNRFIINNNTLWGYCQTTEETVIENDDIVSSSSVSTIDAIQTHAHF